MQTYVKEAFKNILDFLANSGTTDWRMVFQASQFEVYDFENAVSFDELMLNISPTAVRNMELMDDSFSFDCRKHGIDQKLTIPYSSIIAIKDPNSDNFFAWPYFNTKPKEEIQPDVPNKVALTSKLNEVFNPEKSESTPKSDKKTIILDEVKQRGWRIIEGGGNSTPGMPSPLELIHQSRKEKREMDAKLAKVVTTTNKTNIVIETKSEFFPDLDVTKCYFPKQKVKRPEWLAVVK